MLRQFGADLEAFFTEDVEQRATEVFREAAELAAEGLIVGNQYGPGAPVDTGFLRASFRVGLDAPAPGPSTPPSTAGREPGSAPLFSAPVLGPELATVALGQVVFVTTNVEYAAYLEYLDRQRRYGKFAGQSTVFIAPIELRWPRIVEDALRRNVQGNPRGVRFP